MKAMITFSRPKLITLLVFSLLFVCSSSLAEECKSGADLDGSTKAAMESAAQRYYQAAASGNTSVLQQNAIPAIASDFAGIQSAITDNKDNLGSSATVRSSYELDAPGTAPLARAEFYCGIMNSPNYVGFAIPNLPPGTYGLVILDPSGGKIPVSVSFVLQQVGGQWKIGGMYIRPEALAGHDSQWYLTQAQQYKAKGEMHNAWFYYLTAWDLAAPVQFMSTRKLDKIADELQTARPNDLASQQQPLALQAGAKTYNLTNIFAVPLADGLGLVVKYQVPDVSNTNAAYTDNMAVMKALLAKYPEFRQAFVSVVARAVAPSGQDYGTLLAMKDIK
jgi:hypothetical protein